MKTVKERLRDFEEQPPEEMWDKISARLREGKITANYRRKTKITAFITAAAAIATIMVINFVFTNKEVHSPKVTTATTFSDSMEKNNELLESLINAPQSKKLTESKSLISTGIMKYFTIEGPEGEPVKISPKVATLIISADNEFPPKPVWNKQIDEWQQFMLTNNVVPTSVSLMEVLLQSSNSFQ